MKMDIIQRLERQLPHSFKEKIGATCGNANCIDDRHRMVQEWANFLNQFKSTSLTTYKNAKFFAFHMLFLQKFFAFRKGVRHA
jgi:hypothetical protein